MIINLCHSWSLTGAYRFIDSRADMKQEHREYLESITGCSTLVIHLLWIQWRGIKEVANNKLAFYYLTPPCFVSSLLHPKTYTKRPTWTRPFTTPLLLLLLFLNSERHGRTYSHTPVESERDRKQGDYCLTESPFDASHHRYLSEWQSIKWPNNCGTKGG